MGNLAPSSLGSRPRISVVQNIPEWCLLGPIYYTHGKLSLDFRLVQDSEHFDSSTDSQNSILLNTQYGSVNIHNTCVTYRPPVGL